MQEGNSKIMACQAKRAEYLIPWLFFIALLIVYPLMWPRLFYRVNLLGFFSIMEPASITLLAFAGCCLKISKLKLSLKHNPEFYVPLMLITGIILSHIFTVKHISPENIATALVWLAVPLFAFLYHRRVSKILPWFMALLWGLNCWQLIAEQVWSWNSRMMGITGNNNWSAALVAVSTPFVLWLLWIKLGKNIRAPQYGRFGLFAVPIIIISTISIYGLFSKGANIALLGACFITAIVYYCNFSKRSTRLIALGGGVICVLVLFLILNSDLFASYAVRDVRLPLWSGALSLLLDNPVNGVSPAAFESSFATYVPVEYYLRGSIAAARNSHPHSHLLYFAASFGLIATLAWGWLIICPLIKQCSRSLKSTDSIRIIYVFSLLVLLIHGMVDLTLFSWPCGYIFLIILGLLWHDCWNIEGKEKQPSRLLATVGGVLGAILLLCSGYVGYRNGGSSYFNRQALIMIKNKEPKMAIECCNKSLAYKTTPQSLYRAAMIAIFDLKKPKLALSYLKRFDQTTYENYLSNNGLRARALCASGQPAKALPFFERETKNYPIGSLNWHFFYYTLRMLNLKAAADIAQQNLIYSLKVKGMTLNDIPLLIRNSELDLTFLEGDGKTPKIKKLRQMK
jgi:O-antigen ligase